MKTFEIEIKKISGTVIIYAEFEKEKILEWAEKYSPYKEFCQYPDGNEDGKYISFAEKEYFENYFAHDREAYSIFWLTNKTQQKENEANVEIGVVCGRIEKISLSLNKETIALQKLQLSEADESGKMLEQKNYEVKNYITKIY